MNPEEGEPTLPFANTLIFVYNQNMLEKDVNPESSPRAENISDEPNVKHMWIFFGVGLGGMMLWKTVKILVGTWAAVIVYALVNAYTLGTPVPNFLGELFSKTALAVALPIGLVLIFDAASAIILSIRFGVLRGREKSAERLNHFTASVSGMLLLWGVGTIVFAWTVMLMFGNVHSNLYQPVPPIGFWVALCCAIVLQIPSFMRSRRGRARRNQALDVSESSETF